jgi:hypothetical protein
VSHQSRNVSYSLSFQRQALDAVPSKSIWQFVVQHTLGSIRFGNVFDMVLVFPVFSIRFGDVSHVMSCVFNIRFGNVLDMVLSVRLTLAFMMLCVICLC